MRRGSPCAVAPTSWNSSEKWREGEREGGNPPCPPTNVLYPCPSRCDELWNSSESCPMPTDPPRANIWRKKHASLLLRASSMCLSRLKSGINSFDQSQRWCRILKISQTFLHLESAERTTQRMMLMEESSVSHHHFRHSMDATASKRILARRKVSKCTRRTEPVTSETSHCLCFAKTLAKARAMNQA